MSYELCLVALLHVVLDYHWWSLYWLDYCQAHRLGVSCSSEHTSLILPQVDRLFWSVSGTGIRTRVQVSNCVVAGGADRGWTVTSAHVSCRDMMRQTVGFLLIPNCENKSWYFRPEGQIPSTNSTKPPDRKGDLSPAIACESPTLS